MNTKQLLDKIAKNWPAKVICFVIALFIYFSHQMSILEKKTFTVPLTITENGSMVSATQSDRYVKVTVRGQREEIATVTNKDIVAYLDITNETKEGDYTFPVLVQPSAHVQLMEPLEIRVKPEKVPLKIEARTVRYLPFQPVLSGTIAHGYEMKEVVVTPANIKVEGPREMVESLTSVSTEAVDIEGVTESVTRSVLPVNENHVILLDSSTPVTVAVTVNAVILSKDFTAIPIQYDGLSEDLEVKSKQMQADLTIEGTQVAIEQLDNTKVVLKVNCSKITEPGVYELPIMATIGPDLKVTKINMQQMVITVGEKNNATKKDDAELNPTIQQDARTYLN